MNIRVVTKRNYGMVPGFFYQAEDDIRDYKVTGVQTCALPICQHVEEARRILRFSPLGASKDVGKLLDSAVANAEQNPGIVAQNLVVDRIFVDGGPTLRRFRPRAYGRATRVRKRTSHVTVVVKSMGE